MYGEMHVCVTMQPSQTRAALQINTMQGVHVCVRVFVCMHVCMLDRDACNYSYTSHAFVYIWFLTWRCSSASPEATPCFASFRSIVMHHIMHHHTLQVLLRESYRPAISAAPGGEAEARDLATILPQLFNRQLKICGLPVPEDVRVETVRGVLEADGSARILAAIGRGMAQREQCDLGLGLHNFTLEPRGVQELLSQGAGKLRFLHLQ